MAIFKDVDRRGVINTEGKLGKDSAINCGSAK
jgi:hypothetical protein